MPSRDRPEPAVADRLAALAGGDRTTPRVVAPAPGGAGDGPRADGASRTGAGTGLGPAPWRAHRWRATGPTWPELPPPGAGTHRPVTTPASSAEGSPTAVTPPPDAVPTDDAVPTADAALAVDVAAPIDVVPTTGTAPWAPTVVGPGWTPRPPTASRPDPVPPQPRAPREDSPQPGWTQPSRAPHAATVGALADASRRVRGPASAQGTRGTGSAPGAGPHAGADVASCDDGTDTAPQPPSHPHPPAPRSRARWAVTPRAAAAAALAVALLAGGVALRASTAPDGAPVEVPRPRVTQAQAGPPPPDPAPTGSARPAAVHVVGAVVAPGLVTLPADARVADAVAAAGGAAPDADLAGVNLARTVVDGEQLRVPRAGEVVAAPAVPAPGAATGAGDAGPQPAGVDLNTADLAALDALPGVGPVLAQRILDRRAEAPFTSVDELDEVSGIGPAVLERLRPHVRV